MGSRELPIDEPHEMIEAAEGGSDHLTLRAGISLVETGEEPTAGVEVGGELWRVQGRGRLQPFEQARFEVLEHRDLAHILARRKLERTPYLLQTLDKLVAIKGHSSPYVDLHDSPWPQVRKKR